MDPFAPLGRFVDGLQRTCNYSPGNSPNTDCGADATWHIMWNADAEVSFACDPHMSAARRRFVFVGAHQLGPDCGMPDALWDLDGNRCIYPDEAATDTAAMEMATGPSVAECAAVDRAYWEQRDAGEGS